MNINGAAADTLVCDTAKIALWKNDPDFDYERDLNGVKYTFFDQLKDMLRQKLAEWFDWNLDSVDIDRLVVIAGVAALLLVLWFVLRRYSGLFKREEHLEKTPDGDEDTIYGIDFEQKIAGALAVLDYYAAVRYTYLYTLKLLHDEGQIGWQPGKTPTEYIHELTDKEMMPDFALLTNRFMMVRYGNFSATGTLYEEVRAMHDACRARLVQKGGNQ